MTQTLTLARRPAVARATRARPSRLAGSAVRRGDRARRGGLIRRRASPGLGIRASSAADAPPAPPPMLCARSRPTKRCRSTATIPIADVAQSGRPPVRVARRRPGGPRARARMPDQRRLLRSRQESRRRPASGRAGRPQPGPPPGLPGAACAASSTRARPAPPAASSPSPATARSIAGRAPTAGRARARSPQAALAGAVYAPVGYATHYHADYVVPYWASSLAKNAVVGAHIFYRWAGGWGRPAAFTKHYAGREPNAQALRAAALPPQAARPPVDRSPKRSRRSPAPSSSKPHARRSASRSASSSPRARPPTRRRTRPMSRRSRRRTICAGRWAAAPPNRREAARPGSRGGEPAAARARPALSPRAAGPFRLTLAALAAAAAAAGASSRPSSGSGRAAARSPDNRSTAGLPRPFGGRSRPRR